MKMKIKMWLDDIRDPVKFGAIGFDWVKTYDEAIELLKTGEVVVASLDHDLSIDATLGYWEHELTGYDVVCWMEKNDVWPEEVVVHSLNPVGRERMLAVIKRAFGKGKLGLYGTNLALK